jgi:hypothetical protein
MYNYDERSDRPRTYRPDLLPVITKWLTLVPDTAWQYFVGFRVGQRGEFVAKFMKEPTRGGAMRLVTFTLDHHMSSMTTDTCRWSHPAPVRLTLENLNRAVDTI